MQGADNIYESTRVLESKLENKDLFLDIIRQVQLPAVQVMVRTWEQEEILEGKMYWELTLLQHLSNYKRIYPNCTVSLSLFADPERILRRLYVFAEEPCKSTTTTSEPCSPVFKEVQPRTLRALKLEYHTNNLNLYMHVFGLLIIYCCNKKHPTGLWQNQRI